MSGLKLKLSVKKLLVLLLNKSRDFLFFFSVRCLFMKLLRCNIGKNVALHSGIYFYDIGNFNIGSNITINKNVIIDNRAKITIGNNVNISHSVQIYTGSHDLTRPDAMMITTPVRIGNNVWIYPNVTVMPGVCIGSNVIIYPNSVVTKDIESNSVVAGSPARVIKKLAEVVSWQIDNRIHFSL